MTSTPCVTDAGADEIKRPEGSSVSHAGSWYPGATRQSRDERTPVTLSPLISFKFTTEPPVSPDSTPMVALGALLYTFKLPYNVLPLPTTFTR